jgi:hypothetical protein
LGLAYAFVDGHELVIDPNSPIAPKLQFVEAGVAKLVSGGSTGSSSVLGGFLVEECIPESQGFNHFISNGSAIASDFPAGSHEPLIAEFCSFCQHVQWVLTGGKAYCADWQGVFVAIFPCCNI